MLKATTVYEITDLGTYLVNIKPGQGDHIRVIYAGREVGTFFAFDGTQTFKYLSANRGLAGINCALHSNHGEKKCENSNTSVTAGSLSLSLTPKCSTGDISLTIALPANHKIITWLSDRLSMLSSKLNSTKGS